MNILIYLLCFDDASQASVEQNLPPSFQTIHYKIVRLPETNLFLEFYMYTDYLPSHREEWENMDYVGTLSWKFYKKCPINPAMTKFKLSKFPNTDIFSFYNVNLDLFFIAEKVHPQFNVVWKTLFERLGFTDPNDVFPPRCPSFFCNYWIARPKVMNDFLILASRIKEMVENKQDADLQHLLYMDSGYNGLQTPAMLMRNFGKPYYIMMPFVLERVICWYVRFHQLKRLF